MAKTRVDLRLDDGLLRRVDEYAAARLSTRTAVIQAALLEFLGAARGGVPDLPPAVASRAEQAERSVPVPDFSPAVVSDAMLRQQKLNEAKYGRGK